MLVHRVVLSSQGIRRFGRALCRHLEGGICAQRNAVVGVGITRRDQQGTKADHLDERVIDACRAARVFDAPRQALDLRYTWARPEVLDETRACGIVGAVVIC